MRARLLALLARLGGLIGLRSTESDVTVTLEGRWSGKFDPVRLGLTIMVVAMLAVAGFCTALSLANGSPGPVTGGPYQIVNP